uniref:hypothetical protein n=1 Tax=Bradyrhizobium sp. (strain ORS 278) TaxID=114615 RepID=UPI001FCCBBDE|nr:hypothetical protein [Bradyrhizobium sp. ORS 278]
MLLAVALFAFLVSAGVMTAVFARPIPVAPGVLGVEWECAQMFWVTSCTRLTPLTPAARQHHGPHGEAADLRSA